MFFSQEALKAKPKNSFSAAPSLGCATLDQCKNWGPLNWSPFRSPGTSFCQSNIGPLTSRQKHPVQCKNWGPVNWSPFRSPGTSCCHSNIGPLSTKTRCALQRIYRLLVSFNTGCWCAVFFYTYFLNVLFSAVFTKLTQPILMVFKDTFQYKIFPFYWNMKTQIFDVAGLVTCILAFLNYYSLPLSGYRPIDPVCLKVKVFFKCLFLQNTVHVSDSDRRPLCPVEADRPRWLKLPLRC